MSDYLGGEGGAELIVRIFGLDEYENIGTHHVCSVFKKFKYLSRIH